MSYTRLTFAICSTVASMLVFAIWINSIQIYAQQPYPPSPSTAPLLQTRLSELSKQSDSTGSGSNATATTDIPIVLRPLGGGICPQGYHLVSGSVCIKDITTTPTKTTPKASILTPTTPTTNSTKSFSIPSPSAAQPKDNNATNNQENFNTKILKSFNNDFK